MNKEINVLSLFDGMSCGQIALDQLDIKVGNYFASEIDKYAIQITKKNYPNTKHIGSVVDVKGDDLPQIDLLIGGSSCQNFSFAGNQIGMTTKLNVEITSLNQYIELKEKGFEFQGESYLFWEYVRLLKEIKPKYFLLENVKMSKKWQDVITNALGIEPIMINSNLVSAQDRKRLYWTNISSVISQPKDRGIVLSDVWCGGRDITERIFMKKKGTMSHQKAWSSIRTLKQKSKCLLTGGQNISNSGATNVVIDDRYYSLNSSECELLQTVPINYTEGVSETQRFRMLGNGWTVEVIKHILNYLPYDKN